MLSDTRTPEQLAIAQFWAPKAASYMNEVGAGMIVDHKVKEREAAHILALANMAAFDAHIGCWDAKLTYWFFRPYQADPLITTPIGKPNHSSYTSGHSCNTSSYAFGARARLSHGDGIAGRLHHARRASRECTGGCTTGSTSRPARKSDANAAAWAIAHDVVGHEPFPLD